MYWKNWWVKQIGFYFWKVSEILRFILFEEWVGSQDLITKLIFVILGLIFKNTWDLYEL